RLGSSGLAKPSCRRSARMDSSLRLRQSEKRSGPARCHSRLCFALAFALRAIAQLPTGAFVVETREIPVSAHADRALVLWMEHYERIDNRPTNGAEEYSYS